MLRNSKLNKDISLGRRVLVLMAPFVVLLVLVWLFGGLYFVLDVFFGIILALAILWVFLCLWKWQKQNRETNQQMSSMLMLMRDDLLPMAFIDSDGRVLWQNLSFQALQDFEPIQQKLKSCSLGNQLKRIDLSGAVYDIHILKSPATHQYNVILVPSLLDSDQAKMEDQLPVVGYIQIDDYAEVADHSSEDRTLLSGVMDQVEKYIMQQGGIARSYDRGKFIVFMDRTALQNMCQEKFAVLDSVRSIKLTTGIPITLSIAVGSENTVRNSLQAAQDAMVLALGRGGDQAVVKEKGIYNFYGGKLQQGERYSRVKSRVFATSLGNLMRQYDNVFVMGHKMADMDALGASIGLACTAQALHKPVSIIVESSNPMIESYYDAAMESDELRELFISPVEAIAQCSKNTLVIVADTQRSIATPVPEILEMAGAIVVLDHHVRGIDHNITATLGITETRASSTCELVCEVLQYFKPEVQVPAIVASGMLCGIIVDTKNFLKNTSARTFEAAAYLRKHGASSTFVRQVFLEDKQTYLDRAEIVQLAKNITDNIVISNCPARIKDSTLISAQAADALINIKGIDAAFVLSGSAENEISVSARSSEDVNVQLILESIGGGGHFNASGAKLMGSMEEAEKEVEKAVLAYIAQEG